MGRRIAALEKKLEELTRSPQMAATIVTEPGKPRLTRFLARGNWLDDSGPEAVPAIPVYFGKLEVGKRRANRLDLAEWMVARDNPLTSRVFVNRLWKLFFGRGISSTLDDAGARSAWPTHLPLLDWLAVEFIESGWSMKQIHKLIVTSRTYRQSSRVTGEHLEKDPANRYFARAPRVRMSAEMIRDSALAASGLLSHRMHGPPVYPPQPDGIWRHVGRNAPKFVAAAGENRFRRGVYVVWRRGAPYASFVNFDAPDREIGRASCRERV